MLSDVERQQIVQVGWGRKVISAVHPQVVVDVDRCVRGARQDRGWVEPTRCPVVLWKDGG